MKRFVTETRVGEHQIRYRTRIEDVDSVKGSDDARMRQYQFLSELIGQWQLLACGLQMFESLKVYHNGTCWVAEAEATADEPNV
jgi:hypothetical protein